MSLVDRFHQRYGRVPTEIDPDYLEMLRMSKYRIYDFPPVQPSKCANCGSSKVDGRKYVDIDLQVDWYGVVYFCTLCLHDIADKAGLYDELSAEIERANNTALKLSTLAEQGKRLRVELQDVFGEVKEYLGIIDHYITNDDSTPDSGSSMGVNKESTESQSVGTESTTESSKSRASKSTTSSRSKNVPNLAELLNEHS